MEVKGGSYVGNGTSQSITGVGFQPDLVIIKGGANDTVFTLASMGADGSCTLRTSVAALLTDRITALGADGFSVGSNAQVNTNLTTYHYLALWDNGAGDFVQGTYTGDGASSRTITTGFLPDFSYVVRTDSAGFGSVTRTAEITGDPQCLTLIAGALSATGFRPPVATGFVVNNSSNSNSVGNTYFYFAILGSALFDTFTYLGNGVDNTNLSSLVAFTPTWALTAGDFGGSSERIARFKDMAGDLSTRIDANAPTTNLIQSFIAGGVQVGTSLRVNNSGSTYYGFAFIDGSTAAAGTPSLKRVADAANVASSAWASGITDVLPPPSVTVPNTGQVLTIVRG